MNDSNLLSRIAAQSLHAPTDKDLKNTRLSRLGSNRKSGIRIGSTTRVIRIEHQPDEQQNSVPEQIHYGSALPSTVKQAPSSIPDQECTSRTKRKKAKCKSSVQLKRQRLNIALLARLPKVLLHEHLDCSVRAYTILELMAKSGNFHKAIPWRIIDLWYGVKVDNALRGIEYEAARQASRERAARLYKNWISKFARESLKNYVESVWEHIVPIMQTHESLYRITKERIEDAIKDGIIAMELRFAPQLHTLGKNPLGLTDVMDAVISAVKESPIPVNLCICALRHENQEIARQLGDLAIAHRKHVRVFDLAADEDANSGVLDWWLEEALRVRREANIDLTCHLWETKEPTSDDLRKLAEYNIKRLGHGFRGNQQGERVLEICPTSNVVTGQFKSLLEHPIDRLYREGKKVTLNTDGLTFCFSAAEGLTEECFKMHKVFGWGIDDFHHINKTAVEASSFEPELKENLVQQLNAGYFKK